MEDDQRSSFDGHVLLFPFPAQGHINPILQFSKRLASNGLKTTLATTLYLSNTMHLNPNCKVGIEILSNGYDEADPSELREGDAFFETFKRVGSRTLADIIRKYNHENSTSGDPITSLVCDAVLPWALDVGKQFGLVTAAFFTQTCSVSSIYYHVKQGNLIVPVEDPTVSLPGLPLLARQDLPTGVAVLETVPPTSLGTFSDQFSNLDQADSLIFNTFDALETEALQVMRDLSWRIQTVGPLTPSMYLDKRVKNDTENSLSIFKPSENTYLNWLSARKVRSVLYISFGSLAELGEEQMEEVICGIKQSKKDFIWVVREKEQSKLPANFAEEIRDQGLVVPWCSQLKVLGHEAIGCFLTHCGWNSTMEALSLGVPMVAMPRIWDQFTNAKFIQDVWGLGIRVKLDDKGIVTRKELEFCINEVLEGHHGEVIRTNAIRWRKLSIEAVDEGGSSDVNIQEFVTKLSSAVTFAREL